MYFNALLIIDIINKRPNMWLDVNIRNKQMQIKIEMKLD